MTTKAPERVMTDAEHNRLGLLAYDLVDWSESGKGSFPATALADFVKERIAAAVAQERERCAKVCNDLFDSEATASADWYAAILDCAAAIRAEPPNGPV
jgi:hypothetical protein